MLGTDGGDRPGREGANRSDSIMLLRTDPGKRRLAFLSIPRDLQVEIPEVGVAKINAANQIGGPALALRTVEDLTGLDVNHVAFVDFDRFEELVDAVGGIDVERPPTRSARTSSTARTRRQALRRRGAAGGSRAARSTWTAVARSSTRASARTCCIPARPTSTGRDASSRSFGDARQGDERRYRAQAPVRRRRSRRRRSPPTSAPWELIQLGWAYFRADTGRALHCRLGGDPATVGGESVILGTEDNVATVAMFTGRSAPLPPPQGLPYAPGCLVGERRA